MGVLRKILKHAVIQKYFFLEILINVKAGRVKLGARKVYHGRLIVQACFMLYILQEKCENLLSCVASHCLGSEGGPVRYECEPTDPLCGLLSLSRQLHSNETGLLTLLATHRAQNKRR
jgi:hypothetical protein